MYLSKLYIKNYRSIKEIDLDFKKWKNVIVWRNNAWKSNIIKALDLVLWEKSPTYDKSENITESDFFKSNVKEPIYIFCELTKNELEKFDFSSISKSAIFSILKDNKIININIENIWKYDDLAGLFDFEKEDWQALFDDNSSWYKKKWIWWKSYCKSSFNDEFKDTEKVILWFTAENKEWKIIKNLNFLYSNNWLNYNIWVNCWVLRNIFLQSAIIPAFRDTKDQLKISNYSWYWKLLKNYIKSDNKNLLEALENVRTQWQTVFNDMQEKIWDTKINIAFPNTKISFQFNPEKQDIYKNTQIYIDDWFNSPLQDKGSWIQSAVIIWLFDFYVRNIIHSWNSLLAIEEPELYLHPHGRRVISDRLNDFLDWWKNQVIVATHSTEFIVPLADDLNIIVLNKDNEEWTKWKNIDFSWIQNIKRKQILIKKEVAEMFFADLVILTEDSKHFIEEVAKIIWEENKELWKNWLNNNNISVLNCGWKTWFQEYRKLLDYAEIPNYILSDFDYLRDWWINNILNEPLNTELNTLKSKLTTSYDELKIDFSKLEAFFRIWDNLNLKKNFDDLSKELWKRLKSSNYKKISDIDNCFHIEINTLREKLKKEKIFLLNWELEDNYLDDFKPKKSKEWWVIETIAKMMEEWSQISNYINISELKEFLLEIAKNMNKIKSVNEKKIEIKETEKIFIGDLPF